MPALHADDKPYVPDFADLGAAVAGLLGGSLVSELLPLDRRRDDALGANRLAALRRANLHLGPIPIANGAGFGIGGQL